MGLTHSQSLLDLMAFNFRDFNPRLPVPLLKDFTIIGVFSLGRGSAFGSLTNRGTMIFSALIVDAEDGGRKAISAKDKQRVAVIKMYTQLGHYVEAACNDDLATFDTSGFTAVVKTKTPPQPLTEAAFSSIDRRPNSGQAVVKPENQAGAIAFDVRYALEGAGGYSVLPGLPSLRLPVPGK